MRPSLFVEVRDECLFVTAAAVVERGGGALGEEFNGGVAFDAVFFGCGAVGFGVDFGDDDVGFGGEVFGEGFPDWG